MKKEIEVAIPSYSEVLFLPEGGVGNEKRN
jgi:hypothetical protein